MAPGQGKVKVSMSKNPTAAAQKGCWDRFALKETPQYSTATENKQLKPQTKQ